MLGGGDSANRGAAAKGKRTAMIHLCVNPSTTEVAHGRMAAPQAPGLFYPLPAHPQRPLPEAHRFPRRVPPLAEASVSSDQAWEALDLAGHDEIARLPAAAGATTPGGRRSATCGACRSCACWSATPS